MAKMVKPTDGLTYYTHNKHGKNFSHIPPSIEKNDLIMANYESPLNCFVQNSIINLKNSNVSLRAFINNEKIKKTRIILKSTVEKPKSMPIHVKIKKESLKKSGSSKKLSITNYPSPIYKRNKFTSEIEEEYMLNFANKFNFSKSTLGTKNNTEEFNQLDQMEHYEEKSIIASKDLSISPTLKKSHNITMHKFYQEKLTKLNRHQNSLISLYKKEEHNYRKLPNLLNSNNLTNPMIIKSQEKIKKNSKLNVFNISFKNIKKHKEVVSVTPNKKIKKMYIDSLSIAGNERFNSPNRLKIINKSNFISI